MPGRQTTRICAEGWYYLFVVVFVIGGAVLGEVNLLVVLAGVMAAPLLFNWRFVQLTLRDLDVQRKLPRQMCAGNSLRVAVTASNRRRRLTSWAVTVEDALAREGDGSRGNRYGVRVTLPRVAAGQSAFTQYRVSLTRRGRYEFGPLRVSTRFPLGLARASRTIGETESLLVCPRLGHLTHRWLQIVNSRRVGSHQEGHQQGMLEGDYYGLREWRSGDSQRWIHWRTSAKLGELAVRQFEQQRSHHLNLVLDLWEPDSPSEQEQINTEVAISFLATAVADLCQRGGSHVVISVAARETSFWSGPASTIVANEVLENLAVIEPGDGLQIYHVLDRVCQASRSGAHTMVISTRSALLDERR